MPTTPEGSGLVGNEEPRPSYRRTLGNRPFFLLWASQLISQSGDFIFEVALLWLVLQVTGSAFAVAIIVTGTILPGVVLGPFIGVYVDRWDRRRTLMAANVVQGFVVAALSGVVILGKETLPDIFLIVLLLAAGGTIVRVATNAFVPSVVPPHDLPPANGLLAASGSMNQVIGLSIGGVFVALFGVTLPIEYDALTFFAAAVLLLLIPSSRGAAEGSPTSPPRTTGFREEFAEGIRFIRQHRFMLEIIVIGVLVNFLGNGLVAMFAPYTAFVLHRGAEVYGLLGAFVAGGSLIGAAAIGRLDLRRSAGKYLFLGGVTLGPILLAMGLTGNVSIAFVLMLTFGVAVAVTNVPIQVAMQAKVPVRLLGRVGAAFVALVMATSPVGPLFAGWLAQRWSVSAFFVFSGGLITLILVVAALTMTSLRSLRY